MITTTPGDPLLHPGTTREQENGGHVCNECGSELLSQYERKVRACNECMEQVLEQLETRDEAWKKNKERKEG